MLVQSPVGIRPLYENEKWNQWLVTSGIAMFSYYRMLLPYLQRLGRIHEATARRQHKEGPLQAKKHLLHTQLKLTVSLQLHNHLVRQTYHIRVFICRPNSGYHVLSFIPRFPYDPFIPAKLLSKTQLQSCQRPMGILGVRLRSGRNLRPFWTNLHNTALHTIHCRS